MTSRRIITAGESDGVPMRREEDISMHVGLVGPAPWLSYPIPPPPVEMDGGDASSGLLLGDTSNHAYGTVDGVNINGAHGALDGMDMDMDLEGNVGREEADEALPFRQNALWSILFFSFFALLLAALLAFTVSEPFQHFVVRNANALFTIPYVISFVVILAAGGAALAQMNVGVIASASDFLLILLVLIEWAVCLALMLVTLVAVHDGLSYISIDGVIVPRDPSPNAPLPNNSSLSPRPVPDTTVGGIAHNSPIILAIPVFALYALFNVIFHTFSCLEALVRRRRGIEDSDVPD